MSKRSHNNFKVDSQRNLKDKNLNFQAQKNNEYLSLNKIQLNNEPQNVENSIGEYDPNLALKIVGNKGTYQKIAVYMSFWVQFALGTVAYTINYITRYPSFRCTDPDPNSELGYILCSVEDACAEHADMEYTTYTNFITKFQLWCDDAKYEQVAIAGNISVFAGYSVLFFAQVLSDFFGRKFIIKLSIIIICTLYVVIIFLYRLSNTSIVNFWILSSMFTCCWGISNSVKFNQNILLIESCGYKSSIRNKAVVFQNLAFGLQCICMAAFARAFSALEGLFIYSIIMIVIVSPCALFLWNESPLFQFEWGEITNFKENLYRIAIINKPNNPPGIEEFEDMIKFDELQARTKSEKTTFHHKLVEILKHQFCRRENFSYLVCAFIHDIFIEIFNITIITSFNTIEKEDLMLQEVLRGSSNLIAALIQIPIISITPRKMTLVWITLALSAVCFIETIVRYFEPRQHEPDTTFKFVLSFALLILGVTFTSISLLYQMELFSTKIRATGIGLAAVQGRFTSIYYPEMPTEIGKHSIHLTAKLLIPSIIVVIYTLFMPETKYKRIN